MQEMAREHGGLIKHFGGRMARRFYFVEREDIFICIDFAFIKACRAWQPERGTFSTCFAAFAHGECLHFVRDRGYAIRTPERIKLKAKQARELLERGVRLNDAAAQVELTVEHLRQALAATTGLAHDLKGFDLHIDPRPTPWEVLEMEEEELELAA